MLLKCSLYATTNRSGAKLKKMERAGLHMMFYYYSACLHLGKTKENFSIVGVISRVQMKSWAGKALETVNCCAFLKRRLMGVC
jgi:hypothetical protein